MVYVRPMLMSGIDAGRANWNDHHRIPCQMISRVKRHWHATKIRPRRNAEQSLLWCRQCDDKASTRPVAHDTEVIHRPLAENMPPLAQSAMVHHHRWLHRGFRDLLMICNRQRRHRSVVTSAPQSFHFYSASAAKAG